MNNLIIRKMKRSDMDVAINMAAGEGWNPGLYDAETFFNTDPEGYFIAELNGVSAGVISSVAYGNNFGFIGFYIVKKELRGHIIGVKLGKSAMEYLGERNIGIDGVLQKVKNYEYFGFKFAYKNARYEGLSNNIQICPSQLTEIYDIDFPELLKFDNNFFPVSRPLFLKNWINLQASMGYAYMEKNQIKGYGIIRKCRTGYKIGPLFAENFEIAELIFNVLISKIKNEKFFLDIPEINENAVKLVNKYKMQKIFATARMYNKYIPDLPIKKIFGITSFELG